MNKKLLKDEIEACKKAIESMKETLAKCQNGIEIQKLVLSMFEKELKCTDI